MYTDLDDLVKIMNVVIKVGNFREIELFKKYTNNFEKDIDILYVLESHPSYSLDDLKYIAERYEEGLYEKGFSLDEYEFMCNYFGLEWKGEI